MIKKATIVIMAIFVVFVTLSLVAQEKKPEQKAPAQEQAAPAEQPQQTAPAQQQQAAPAEEKQAPAAGAAKVEKHWSKYVYPEELPADAKIHIIEKGDCLWNLAGKYLTNSLQYTTGGQLLINFSRFAFMLLPPKNKPLPCLLA